MEVAAELEIAALEVPLSTTVPPFDRLKLLPSNQPTIIIQEVIRETANHHGSQNFCHPGASGQG